MSGIKTFIFSLRLRIIVALFAMFVVLIGSLLIAARSNEQAEDRIYRDFVNSRSSLLDESMRRNSELLQTFVYDYTYWDEMVSFTQNPTEQAASLIFNGSLDTYDADLLWVYNAAGELVYALSDSESISDPYTTTPLPAAKLSNYITATQPLINYYTRTDAGMLEVYAASIHPTEDEARATTPQGYFFAAKLLDNTYLDSNAETVGGELRVIYDPDLIQQQQVNFDHHSGSYGFIKELPGIEQQVVGALYASGYSESIHQVLTFRDRILLATAIIFGATVIFGYLMVYGWILKPLFNIQAALKTKDERHIAALKHHHDEFSLVANLMSESMNLLGNHEAIMASIKDGLVITDESGIVRRINQTALTMLGYEEHELISKSFIDTVPALDYNNQRIAPEKRPLSVALTSQQPVESSHVFIGKDERHVDVRLKVSPILRGDHLTGAIIIFNDNSKEVSSRRAIEKEVADKTAELSRVRARLEASINSLHLGFIMTDQDNGLVMVNDSARKLLSLETSGTIGSWTFDEVVMMLHEAIDLKKAVKSCLNDWDPVSVPEAALGEHMLRIFVSPVLSHDDGNTIKAIGCVVLIEDITESVIATRSRDEFFSIASHELRTPLTSIKGNSAMLLEYYAEALKEPSAHEMVEDIHESSQRLITIVNDFLDVSKIEQGKLKYEFTSLDIQEVIDEVLKDLHGQAANKHLELIAPKAMHIPSVIGDKDRLKQIIYNLVGNAIKYTADGTVTVSCELQQNMVKVSVSDTGAGIPEERQKLLFRKFQQAGNSIWTRQTSNGTGLGLYISKLLVEGMGGTIWLEKTKGKHGSTFSFTLLIDNELNNGILKSRTQTDPAKDINTETGLVS